MNIIIDTREQRPYDFTGFNTVRAKLDAGDYSIEGFEQRVAVERKSKEDAYGCVGAGRDRFERCLDRLSKFDRSAVVIECSLVDFAVPPSRTMIDQRQAIGSYISWQIKYNVPVVWLDNRAFAERWILRYFASYLKYRAVEK